ncbi:hypothetical protein GGS26DRAFT_317639 [Hypomontagnella submonticulosa]|nr:hypothetical protein GGS26DRAFT_317639 [Hypomontagnella submonticulosa]
MAPKRRTNCTEESWVRTPDEAHSGSSARNQASRDKTVQGQSSLLSETSVVSGPPAAKSCEEPIEKETRAIDGAWEREFPSLRLDADSHRDKDAVRKETVFTGEYRTPLRERLKARRREVEERAKERRESGSISDHLESMTNSPSNPPSRSSSRTSSPPARKPVTPPSRPPSAEYLGPELRRLLDQYVADNNDILFDRRATKQDVDNKRLSQDLANERQRKRITAPPSPSPLRRSYNADEMAKLSSALKALQTEESVGDGDGDADSIKSRTSSHGEAPQSWI